MTNGRDVIWALTDGDDNEVYSSKHVASISEEVYTNSVSVGVIIKTESDFTFRLTNLTKDCKKVTVHAATVTVFKLG